MATPVLRLLTVLVEEQTRQRETLAQILRLLERGRGARDAGDVELVRVIAAVSGGLPITAAALWRRRAAGDAVLADALATCDIENPKQLGKLLKRLGDQNVGGLSLDRVGVNREGTVWRARVQE
jgi:hypothetical protein